MGKQYETLCSAGMVELRMSDGWKKPYALAFDLPRRSMTVEEAIRFVSELSEQLSSVSAVLMELLDQQLHQDDGDVEIDVDTDPQLIQLTRYQLDALHRKGGDRAVAGFKFRLGGERFELVDPEVGLARPID